MARRCRNKKGRYVKCGGGKKRRKGHRKGRKSRKGRRAHYTRRRRGARRGGSCQSLLRALRAAGCI